VSAEHEASGNPTAGGTIVHAEALAWLAAHPAPPFSSVVTSLPDVSEMPTRDFGAWRAWFGTAARAVLQWVPDEGVTIFFQSDIRHAGAWVDKGYLVQRAADEVGAPLVWHKIVCRKPPGTIAHGRASYSHMLCFAKDARHARTPRAPGPDVLPDAGFMPWTRAMGSFACAVACRFVRDETTTRHIVDPFCGHGTALAVAKAMGFATLGVDASAKCCRAARRLLADGSLEGPKPGFRSA
jgi:hypothetical protein